MDFSIQHIRTPNREDLNRVFIGNGCGIHKNLPTKATLTMSVILGKCIASKLHPAARMAFIAVHPA